MRNSGAISAGFLYSQDLSNRKTTLSMQTTLNVFLYSQDLSNRKTWQNVACDTERVFVLSRFK